MKSNKQDKEKKIIKEMISIYCKIKHKKTDVLCIKCQELVDYAYLKIEKCPFKDTKSFCSNCKIHCYNPDMKIRIREVMIFSKKKMIYKHPIMTVSHMFCAIKEKRNIKRGGKND